MKNRIAAIAAAMATLCTGSTLAADQVLRCGAVIDVEQGRTLGPHVFVIEGDRITDVIAGSGYEGAGDLIDLSGHTCMPGLIDLHTHLSNEFGPTTYLDRFRDNTADVAIGAVRHARVTLEAGFTTVRDLGDSDNVTVALRNAISAGTVEGPRIFTAAKSIATTGGHADPTNGMRDDLSGDPGPREGVVNGVAEARKAVRQRYKDGADLIKITATGGVLSPAKNGQNPQFFEDEMSAIVETAREYGMVVAAHAHGAEGMKRAIRAGVATIEHGTLMDDETMALMIEHGTVFVPTLMAGEWVAEKSAIAGFFPEVVRPKAASLGPLMSETFSRAVEAGVPIAFGTDSGVSAHGDNAREFELMVAAGMAPMAAIQSATIRAAEVLRAQDTLGVLAAGYSADVVAVDGDPVADVRELQDIDFVMKAGAVYVSP